MRILVMAAHPDDGEMNCGGTIAKYIQLGHEVFLVQACQGDKGDYVHTPKEMRDIRWEESRRAGSLVGAKVDFLEVPDGELEYSQEYLKLFVEKIREINPYIIITHGLEDYHPDHVATGKLVIDASFLVSVPSVFPDSRAIAKVPQIYFMEPYTGVGFIPQEFVDITDFLKIKLEMMKCHKSQVKWLGEHDDLDILDYIETSSKYRGFQCGVKYAESFVRYTAALRTVPGRFLP